MNAEILELKDLRRTFGGVIAVDNLNFTVERGTVTSVIGPNGAGKTTVFNLVTGFLKPSAGAIRYGNREISGKPVHVIASLGIARTFQNVQVFPNMTVLENVMVGRHTRSRAGLLSSCILPPFLRKEEKEIRLEAHKWLAFVGMDDFAAKLAGSLPLGNQRMLEIARALAMKPHLLLLDEPASGLNARETLALGELIGRIKDRGITVALVEHDMELVMEISDKVVVINFGRCIAKGTPVEIQENPAVVAAYLGK